MILSINISTQYIQGGEDSFWLDTFQSALGAVLGFLFGFALYQIQRRVEKRKEIANEKALLKDEMIFFNNLIKGAVKHIEGVFTSANRYKAEQSKDFIELQNMPLGVNKDILRIDKKDPKMDFIAYRYFFSKNESWVEDFKKLYQSLDLIQASEVEIKRLFQRHTEESVSKLNEAKNFLEETINRLASRCMQFGDNRQQFALYKLLNDRILEYRKLVDEKAKLNEYKIFLESLSKDMLNSANGEAFAEEVLYLSKRSRMLMAEAESDTKHFIGELKNIEDNMKRIIQDVKTESNKIEQTLIIS